MGEKKLVRTSKPEPIVSDEEYGKFLEFRKIGNECLMKNEGLEINPPTRDFAIMVQGFNIITEHLDFSVPFRLVIDYDPEQPRTVIKQYFPKEVL